MHEGLAWYQPHSMTVAGLNILNFRLCDQPGILFLCHREWNF